MSAGGRVGGVEHTTKSPNSAQGGRVPERELAQFAQLLHGRVLLSAVGTRLWKINFRTFSKPQCKNGGFTQWQCPSVCLSVCQ